VGVVHALAADEDLACGRSLQPRDHAEQRGLAASGRAEQHQELALANREVHVVDRIELRESLAEVPNLDAGHRLWALPGRVRRAGRRDSAFTITTWSFRVKGAR